MIYFIINIFALIVSLLWFYFDFGFRPFITTLVLTGTLIEQLPKIWHYKKNYSDLLEHHKKLKNEIEENLQWIDNATGYGRAIIRDVCRMNSYPNIDSESKGISPCFKVGIKGIYHNGIELFLRIERLKYDEASKSWRLANIGEEYHVNGYLVGKIPFDRIRSIDWEGDEYDNIPHFYCDFDSKRKAIQNTSFSSLRFRKGDKGGG